jgi:hypothetical protein
MSEQRHTVLGGTLMRMARDNWVWKDGTPELRVRDLPIASEYNFRCTTVGYRKGTVTYVEIPLDAARKDPMLEWVAQGHAAGIYSTSQSGDHTGQMVVDAEGGITKAAIMPGTDESIAPLPQKYIPKVILVPAVTWDTWASRICLGACWDRADEPGIFALAKKHGWSPPPAATPSGHTSN